MKASDINIRDPFVLPYGNKYYMYGTRGKDFGCKTGGFDVYTSYDLVNWSEPIECFTSEQFNLNKSVNWAPEVHIFKGNFYMFATFQQDNGIIGTHILKSDNPLGPFVPHSNGAATPKEWVCIDGTFYVDSQGTPYIVFCHEWKQVGNGEVCYAQLNEDLSCAVSEPKLMFTAHDYSFASDIRGDGAYVTDGCFLYRNENGDLSLIWSSIGEKGYLESVLKSDNGEIDGKWISQPLLFEEDGGHGMLFRDFNGDLKFSLHAPNTKGAERVVLFDVEDKNGLLSIK